MQTKSLFQSQSTFLVTCVFVRTLICALFLTTFLATIVAIPPNSCAQDANGPQKDVPVTSNPNNPAQNEQLRPGVLIPVSLPVTSSSADVVRKSLEAAIKSNSATSDDKMRPIVLLEFDTRNSKTGQGSDFHSCLALAELLTDMRMNRLWTVAYIPGPEGLAPGMNQLDSQPISQLKGHAVLVALACNELAMHNEASIGEAGIDEKIINRTRVVAYEEIASKRGRFPVPLVRSLINKDDALFWVQTAQDISFVGRAELESLLAKGVSKFDTITEEGSAPLLSSQLLSEYRLIENRVESRRQLSARLSLDDRLLEIDPSGGKDWKAVQLNVSGYLDKRTVSWLIRSMNQQSDSINLIVVKIDSADGEPFECLRLAEYLAGFDSKVQTVAYVPENAGAAAALIALSCNQLMMAESAKLGGAPETPYDSETFADLARAVKSLAPKTQRNWSVLMAFTDPSVKLEQMRHSNGPIELYTEQERSELEDADEWNSLGSVTISDDGMTGSKALQYKIASMLISDFEQLKAAYLLRANPTVLEPTLADQWIESFARTLASPWVAGWLLFGAVFLISTEMSSPGISLPGFLGTLCLILFFWSQYFDGNAHWLEIMLFVAGAVFIALEMFVLPGFGIFGIGGLIMVVTSIVLATQTFVIPRDSADFNRLPVSLTMVLAAAGGFFVAIALFGKYLPKTPFFKRLLLDPDEDGDSPVTRKARESIVNWAHLLGESGTAVTKLAPAGKARIGSQVVDVISGGRLIEKGAEIKVVEVSGNRVVVKSVEEST